MSPKEQIKGLYKELDRNQQKELLLELSSLDKRIKLKEEEKLECRYCKNKEIIKNGKPKSFQRYKCKSCNRNFINTTVSLYQGIKKRGKLEDYKTIMLSEGMLPLKQMALRLGISIQTAFDWRHKILISLKTQPKKFYGITELDDVWFLYSQKGRKGLDYSRKRGGSKKQGDNNFQVKMLITSDRKQTKDLSIVRIGRLQSSDINRKVGEKIGKSCTLVSDKHRSISAFAKQNRLDHISFKSSDHIADSQHHVQTVNNLASRIKAKLNYVLRGVSTKYLQNYANWYQFIESNKYIDNIEGEANKTLMRNNNSWNIFTSTEVLYKKFIKQYSKRTYRCPTKRKWKAQLKNTISLTSLFYY